MSAEPYVTASQAAHILKVEKVTVMSAITSGRLKTLRDHQGRYMIHRDDLATYDRERKAGGKARQRLRAWATRDPAPEKPADCPQADWDLLIEYATNSTVSMATLAEARGVSRQAVHQRIMRARAAAKV